MISASRSYQMNVEAMNVSRVLLLKTLDMGK
jgi:flagellar basal-body rod protein FlgC